MRGTAKSWPSENAVDMLQHDLFVLRSRIGETGLLTFPRAGAHRGSYGRAGLGCVVPAVRAPPSRELGRMPQKRPTIPHTRPSGRSERRASYAPGTEPASVSGV